MTAALHNVTKSYQFAPGAPAQVVLRDLHLEIPAGSATAIMGASGCGKSTLLQIMGTLDTPDAGSVRLFDQEVAGLDDAALSRLRAEKIGFIFQLHHLLPHLTALENVLVPVLSGGAEKGTDYAARGRELLARCGLESHMDKKPAQLSGGERQRVAVARALIRRPALLLADEPTGALDSATAGSLIDLLLELHAGSGSALVLVTHDAAIASRMERQVRMKDGVIVEG